MKTLTYDEIAAVAGAGCMEDAVLIGGGVGVVGAAAWAYFTAGIGVGQALGVIGAGAAAGGIIGDFVC